jgi:hypothetical protein
MKKQARRKPDAESDRKPVAHLYARISHPDQRKGGGLERQTSNDAAGFCQQYGFDLGKRVRVDDGVSAFKGLNATPEHELGKFLADARRNIIQPGDCLLLENYDRLSRQGPWIAIGLVTELRQLGIHVGRLDRMKLLRCDSEDMGEFFEASIEFMRGHSESSTKSDRNKKAWIQKRQAAEASGAIITHRLPAWIEDKDGKLCLIEGPARTVKLVFSLAIAGYGHQSIVKRLIADNVPPIGHSGRWARSYVNKVLNDRRVLGEIQPRNIDREPIGEPIPGYFPAVISEQEFFAARAGASQRRLKRGRNGKIVNVFKGLLNNARDGDSYFVTTAFTPRTRGGKGPGDRVLKNMGSVQGRAKCFTFPFSTFESAVLSCLHEIDPHDILNGNSGPDDTLALRGQFDAVEDELAEVAAFMSANGFSQTLGKRITELEAHKDQLAAKLALAREKAAHPLSESWGEAKTLLSRMIAADSSEDVRLRLRSTLRRIVESVWLLVVPRGSIRLCAVQVWFAEVGRHRNYLICHRPSKANASARTEGGWSVRSLASMATPDDLDLRRREDAEALERVLAKIDLSPL